MFVKLLCGVCAVVAVASAVSIINASTKGNWWEQYPVVEQRQMNVFERLERFIPVANDGHFYPNVIVNGIQIRAMADTGAAVVALTYQDAYKIGYDPRHMPFNSITVTANGQIKTTNFTLPQIFVAGIEIRDVPASCCIDDSVSLLGMSALRALKVSFDKDTMTISY